MARKKKPPLAGKLAEPIGTALVYPTLVSGMTREDVAQLNEAERKRGFEEAVNRLELLFPYYGLDRTGNDAVDFRLLALALAKQMSKGFHIRDVNESKPYKQKRGNPLTLLLLLADAETIKRERSCTDREAAHQLKDDERFMNEWKRIEVDTLCNMLSEARNPDKNRYWPSWQSSEVARQVLTLIANRVARGVIPGTWASRKNRDMN